MKYVKAEGILPANLVKEIQKYVQGQYVYIPSEPENKKRWGENSGNREYIKERNESIRSKYYGGSTIEDLSDEFYLSVYTIKKIIYSKAV